jgi:hypothetical protein
MLVDLPKTVTSAVELFIIRVNTIDGDWIYLETWAFNLSTAIS